MINLKDHLKQRKLDTKLHTTWLDTEVASFPLYNLSEQLIGYQQYRPKANKAKCNHPKDSRYYTYLKKGSTGVWGIEAWRLSNTLFITEGMFDACRLTNRGYSAVALLSNNPKHLTSWLFSVRSDRKVVAVCDNGPTGVGLRKFAHEWMEMPKEFDLGDAPESFVTKLIEEYK